LQGPLFKLANNEMDFQQQQKNDVNFEIPSNCNGTNVNSECCGGINIVFSHATAQLLPKLASKITYQKLPKRYDAFNEGYISSFKLT